MNIFLRKERERVKQKKNRTLAEIYLNFLFVTIHFFHRRKKEQRGERKIFLVEEMIYEFPFDIFLIFEII